LEPKKISLAIVFASPSRCVCDGKQSREPGALMG
jgi:hypothetical protein